MYFLLSWLISPFSVGVFFCLAVLYGALIAFLSPKRRQGS